MRRRRWTGRCSSWASASAPPPTTSRSGRRRWRRLARSSRPRSRRSSSDSGFYSEAAVQAVECQPDGTPSGVTVLAAVEKLSHHKTVADLLPQPEPPAPGPEASAKERMAHRLKTARGKALYKLRKQTVEPVF